MIRLFWRSAAQLCLLILCVLSCAVPLAAQQTLGSVNGTVKDSSGAAIAGATVTVTETATNRTLETKTQANGFYQIFNLPIGFYTVKATHEGFETTRNQGNQPCRRPAPRR